MVLQTTRWGVASGDAVVCIHGVGNRGSVFAPLGRHLSENGHTTIAVDLRGHGASRREPPWDAATHVEDLLETCNEQGIERPAWVGHSFGALVAATLAARAPERVKKLALLEPAIQVSPEYALRSAEINRLDWDFASPDGATNALMSSAGIASAANAHVAAYVRDDVRRQSNGRFRFSQCPSAVVVAWSEMARAAPAVADVPTLIVRAAASHIDGRDQDDRYRMALGSRLKMVQVPHGHNVMWESPGETVSAIKIFLAA